MGPYEGTAGDEGDKVGQEGLRPEVAKEVQAGWIQDEENGFNAVGSGELLVSFGMRMDMLSNDEFRGWCLGVQAKDQRDSITPHLICICCFPMTSSL